MGWARRLGAVAMRLPRGCHHVAVQRDLAVPVAEGVALLSDHYLPVGVDRSPTILVRSPYGRRGPFGMLFGYVFAAHGFHAVVQSVRGGFGSGGAFDPLGDERDDGLATVDWLRAQPWFDGSFAMFGPSYSGFAQWAIAAEAGPELKAMATQVTASQFHDAMYYGGGFALEAALTWVDMTARMERPLSWLTADFVSPRRARRAALSGRPLAELDALATGQQSSFFQEVLQNGPQTPFWARRDFSATVAAVEAPVNMMGGWYDIFLPWQLKDYAALRAAGRRPYLTIGPWSHSDGRMMRAAVSEALTWFRAHLTGDPSELRDNPVRLYVTGAGEWREFSYWPVPGIREERWRLQPDGGLAPVDPLQSAPDTYRYDPANPTPCISGPSITGHGRPADQRRLERRHDVLTFTSPVLTDDLEIVGPVGAELYMRSDRMHTDVVVRLCDVSPKGESLNLCEGMRRLTPDAPDPDGDGVRRVEVQLWPTAHRFRAGHRVRLHVCSGAYPRVARNPGTGAALGTATRMLTADQAIFHDPGRSSAVVLPVVG
ncbi:CocE/NonD family hydrolase [Nonomuraea jiangxiensis]|nr:CocE/NonD family hydrolase [Nonomuraea jiangxiensis]